MIAVFKMSSDKNWGKSLVIFRRLHHLGALKTFQGGQKLRTLGLCFLSGVMVLMLTYFQLFRGNTHWKKPVIPFPFKFRKDMQKAKLPRYSYNKLKDHPIPIWVLSLKHSKRRRENVIYSINNPFEFVDALNVSESLPMGEFQILMGGPRLWSARRGDMFAQKKLSIDYGHIRVLAKLIASSEEVCIVLEDDAEPSLRNIDIQSEVLQILKKVPQDWDIIYLTEEGSYKVSNVVAAKGIKILHSCSGTMAYMVRREAALKILAEILTNKLWLNIDMLYCELIKDGKLNGYLALPGLLKRSSHVGGSILDYEKAYRNPIYKLAIDRFG